MKKILCTVVICVLTVLLIAGCQAETAPTSPAPTPSAAAPAKLAFIAQPGDAAAGEALSTQPVVAVQDAEGNTITNSILPITLTITPGAGSSGARLFGPSTINASEGEARFQNLSINLAGTGYTLTASSGDLTPAVSMPFNISPGTAAKLAFATQPSGGTAGEPLAVQPVVTVQDRFGNPVPGYNGEVSIGITFGSASRNATIMGTTTVPMTDSQARFTDIQLNTSGREYTLTATSPSLEPATSDIFTVDHAAPAKLEFTVQPEEAAAGRPFEIQPKVAIEDTYGNVVLSARETVTVTITPGTGTSGAVLSGTRTFVSEDGLGGLVEFIDLTINLGGTGYTLTATSGNLTPATSAPFNVAG